MKNKFFFNAGIFIIVYSYILFCQIFDYKNIYCTATILLLLNLYLIIKSKNNILLFYLFIVIFYFNYSIVITKYVYNIAPILESVYYQIKNNDIRYIGINCLLIFINTIGLILGNVEKVEINDDTFKLKSKFKGRNVLIIVLIFSIALILLLSMYWKIIPRSIYEYSIILFLFGFLLSKRYNKDYNYILSILLMISISYTLYVGGRVIILQPCILFVFIFFAQFINKRNLIISIICGILLFTFFGLYGDIVQFSNEKADLSSLTIKNLLNSIIQRRFALDTSVSSYWTGLTFIKMTQIHNFNLRLNHFFEFVKYSLLLSNNKYIELAEISRQHFVHYYGGNITAFFYYWLGYSGVIIISIYVGILFKKIKDINYRSDFEKMYLLYFVATLPRWYLYYPTILFRSSLIFVIVYLLIMKFFEIKK